jgi:iron complex transport system permease protein
MKAVGLLRFSITNKRWFKIMMFPVAGTLLAVIFVLSIRFGSVQYTVEQILGVIFGFGEFDETLRTIIINVRLPRTLVALIVGANLAVSGALLQAVMRNELADPGLTGISTGASLAALIIMLAFPAYGSFVPAAAFIGAAISFLIVYSLAWRRGVDPIRIVLAGVAVNALLGGASSLLSLLYSDRLQGVLMWLNGSMSGRSWHHVNVLVPYAALGLLGAFLCIKSANLLQLGDDMAKNLGLKVNLARIVLSAIAAFTAAVSVSVVGLVGFVGLIVPHISRLLVGSDYRFLLPFSALLGSVLLLGADTAARTLFSPIELPVGILMAVVGGPFFLWLLRRKGKYKL